MSPFCLGRSANTAKPNAPPICWLVADDLGLTQCGLSRAISRLENERGVRLLQRNTRSVSLRPTGRGSIRRPGNTFAEALANARG